MTTRSRTLLAAALLVASTFACAGGQTGDEGDSAPLCDEKPQALAAGAVSPLGFSAADVLAYVAGHHAVAIEWQPGRPFPYGPEQGAAELSFDVESLDRARFVERWDHGSTDTLIGGDCCPDSVQLDVRITLRTSGGALDETFDAVLDATRRDAAHLLVLVKPPLTGTLTFDQQALGSQHLEDLQLDARFSPDELNGTLHARIESDSAGSDPEGSVSLTTEPLAQWGQGSATSLCGE